MNRARINVKRVRPGDTALHYLGLDGREVSRTEQDMNGVWYVWLWIGQRQVGPFPAENYDFIRRVEE